MRFSIYLLFFFVPFAAFALYRVWVRGRGGEHSPEWPWIMLTVVGVALVAAAFALFRFHVPDETECGKYVPAHYENGQLVDGHCERTAP